MMSESKPNTTLGMILNGLPAHDHPLNAVVTRVELGLDRVEWLLQQRLQAGLQAAESMRK